MKKYAIQTVGLVKIFTSQRKDKVDLLFEITT